MSPRKHGPPKPNVDWEPGDAAWRLDDEGRAHETVIRSKPWQICGHWSVLCDGVSGGYNEERFYRGLYFALMAGVRMARERGGDVARAERALGMCTDPSGTVVRGGMVVPTPALIVEMRRLGLVAPLPPSREVGGEGGGPADSALEMACASGRGVAP